MYSAEEAFKDTIWLFEKLLNQRGDAKWIETDLGRCAEILLKLPFEIDESYSHYNELVRYYTKHVNKRADRELRSQKRRHEYRHNFKTEDWLEALEHFEHKCAYCNTSGKMTIDHFIPFSKGGELAKGNIIPACKSCNSSKNNRSFEEWYTSCEFYSEKQEHRILDFINR